jgi:transcriptional regulator with XRE-family HTH domain
MGNRLKRLRLSAGKETAEDFATAIGLHPAGYRKYERGEVTPPLDVLEDIINILDENIELLLL